MKYFIQVGLRGDSKVSLKLMADFEINLKLFVFSFSKLRSRQMADIEFESKTFARSRTQSSPCRASAGALPG